MALAVAVAATKKLSNITFLKKEKQKKLEDQNMQKNATMILTVITQKMMKKLLKKMKMKQTAKVKVQNLI